jgi:tRNA pseudouridine55 synthase
VLVECSSGTYVRTLAADLGVALGGVAHVGTLRRLAVGRFELADAHPLAEVEEQRAKCVLPIAGALRELAHMTVDDTTARAVAHGATLAGESDGPLAVCDEAGEVLAVYEPWRTGVLKPSVVLARPEPAPATTPAPMQDGTS